VGRLSSADQAPQPPVCRVALVALVSGEDQRTGGRSNGSGLVREGAYPARAHHVGEHVGQPPLSDLSGWPNLRRLLSAL